MKLILMYFKKLHEFSGKVLYYNIFGMGAASLLEGIGILLLVQLIQISGAAAVPIHRIPFLNAEGFLNRIPREFMLPLFLGFYIAMMTLQGFCERKITIKNVEILHNFSRKLRISLYKDTLLADWKFYLNKRKSDLINSLTSELARVVGGINFLLQLISSVVFTVIQLIIAFWLSAKITSLVLICGLILIFFSKKFIKKATKAGVKSSVLAQEYMAGITDDFNGFKEIKSNSLEASRIKWFRTLTQKMSDEQVDYTKLQTGSELFHKIASAILIACFIFISIQLLHESFAQILLIIVIFSRIWPRFTLIQTNIQQIASTIPAFESIHALHRECSLSRELSEGLVISNEPAQRLKGIECRQVYFRYEEKKAEWTLKKIHLSILPGQMTAIVGRSGAGKSTLVDLLMGLIKPDQGEVLYNGNLLSKDSIPLLRKSLSYVPQDPFLFNGRIRDNLSIVKPDITENEMWESLEFSSAAEFVRKLEDGLDTVIGDRGIRLSGGERQRLVLARAILRKPEILVLDEATSAMDTVNEANIQTALDNLKGKMTIIVIAHRFSTIKNADQVIVLENGEIIQKGSFNQLLDEKQSMFSLLLGKQLESNNEKSLLSKVFN